MLVRISSLMTMAKLPELPIFQASRKLGTIPAIWDCIITTGPAMLRLTLVGSFWNDNIQVVVRMAEHQIS